MNPTQSFSKEGTFLPSTSTSLLPARFLNGPVSMACVKVRRRPELELCEFEPPIIPKAGSAGSSGSLRHFARLGKGVQHLCPQVKVIS